MSKPFNLQILMLLKVVYLEDNTRVTEIASDLVDALIAYSKWAFEMKDRVDYSSSDQHALSVIMEEITECIDTLHRSQGCQDDAIHLLKNEMLINYCLGFLLRYFVPDAARTHSPLYQS